MDDSFVSATIDDCNLAYYVDEENIDMYPMLKRYDEHSTGWESL
jgi:hypothetical protein